MSREWVCASLGFSLLVGTYRRCFRESSIVSREYVLAGFVRRPPACFFFGIGRLADLLSHHFDASRPGIFPAVEIEWSHSLAEGRVSPPS
jgi:hypothetical protein